MHYGYSPTARKCDGHSPTVILRAPEGQNWALYLGSRDRVISHLDNGHEPFDLIVNLSGGSIYYKPPLVSESAFEALNKYYVPSHALPGHEREVVMDWPNYSIPASLPFQFWVDLYQVIKSVPRTIMFCIGSHGRTGTAAVLLLLVSHAFDDSDEALRWLRKNYCEKCVESTAQMQMIRDFAKWLKERV